MAIYKNITTSDTHTLISKAGVDGGAISKVLITNTDTLQAERVELYLDDGTNRYYFIKGVDIPPGVTLLFDEFLSFNKAIYKLELRTYDDLGGGAPSLTVMIK
jgi:hypothetical protein